MYVQACYFLLGEVWVRDTMQVSVRSPTLIKLRMALWLATSPPAHLLFANACHANAHHGSMLKTNGSQLHEDKGYVIDGGKYYKLG